MIANDCYQNWPLLTDFLLMVGFYTYFATNGFTYGSTWKNWRSLSKFAHQNGLIFVPSVGPGYIDTQVSYVGGP